MIPSNRELVHKFKHISGHRVDRRTFLKQSFLAALSGVAITVSACGGETQSGGSGSQGSGGESGSISGNHGHSAFLSAAQLSQGDGLDLDITGASGHPHSISLSSSQIQAISQGSQVSVVSSSDDGHTHTVSFN